MRKAIAALAVLTLAAHLLYLPPTLDDLDAVNFALGVRDFDVAQHQPHPPGYPVFIALGKVATWALGAAGVASPEVRGLAVWSALAAGLLPLLWFAFFRALDPDGDEWRPAVATVLATCAPLVWFSGLRPLSDMSGLAVAGAALAALGTGLVDAQRGRPSRWLIVGAGLAGVAIGCRSQMAILTGPFVLTALVIAGRQRLAMLAAGLVGILVWAVPLVMLSGGPGGYLRALGSQAGEDFSGVVMLWTHRTPRVAVAAFLQTFVRPWDAPMLAGVLLALALAGLAVLARQSRRTLVLLAIAFGPYAIFHLLFQETVTIRYALPLIPLMAYLAAVVLSEAAPPIALATTTAIAAVSLACAVPAMTAYAAVPSPVFALLSEMRLLQARGAQPIVGMHRRVFTESRRARVYAGDPPGTLLATPRDYEWLELTRAWREGRDGESWFVADPARTDLALVDRAHARTRQYRWPFDAAVYVGGARPNEIDWHIFNQPGWFLEQGWALTPEIAGITDRDGWGPHRRPSLGWVRRRPDETLMTIGGRHLGGDPPVRVIASIDDRPVATLDVRPGYFLEMVPLPAGALAGAGTFARLTVTAQSASGGAVPPVAIEQFNLQTPDAVQFGFDEGWYEPEYNPATARSWRWSSERALVRVHAPPGQAVVLRVTGESPRRYFRDAPHVRVSAGDRVLQEITPSADFSVEVPVPADALAAANGRITITSDRAYVPSEREGSADRRHLALRIYTLSVDAQVP